MTTRLACLIAALLFSAACATADGPATDASSTEQVTRTIVQLNDDGTETVTHQLITVAEQQAELATNQRLEEEYLSDPEGAAYATAPVRDPGCSWYSLKLFDGATYTGNYICFSGSGFVNLGNYCRNSCPAGRICLCSGKWAGAVRSYWSGSNSGVYYAGTQCPNEDFMPQYEARSTVSSCIQASSTIRINLSAL